MQRGDPSARPVVATFLALALAFGGALVVLTPPFDAPDEPRHLQRVWLLSLGGLGIPPAAPGAGAAIPASLLELHPPYQGGTHRCRHDGGAWSGVLGAPLEPERTSDAIRTPILYGPIGYVAPALALVPARWLGAGTGTLLLVARFANLLAWAALCAAAIACAPARRGVYLVAASLPMSLFLAATVSADAVAHALSLWLVAGVARASLAGGAIVSRADRVRLLVLTALLGLGKPGATWVALAVIAIPDTRFASRRERARFVAAVLGVGVLVPVAWWLFAQRSGPFPYPNADPVAQLSGLLRAPWRLLAVVVATWLDRPVELVRGAIGVLGRLDVVLPAWVHLGYGLLLVGAGVTVERRSGGRARGSDEGGALLLPARSRGWLAAVAVGGSATVIALLYVSATPPGAARAVGVQGRYLLPLLPLLALALPARLEATRVAWAVGIGGLLVGGVATLQAVAARYYGS